MPQTTEARRKRWPGMDSQAIVYLEKRGFIRDNNFSWYKPSPNYKLTRKERDALVYLNEEWDWGGLHDYSFTTALELAVIGWREEKIHQHKKDCGCPLCVHLGTLADDLIRRRKP